MLLRSVCNTIVTKNNKQVLLRRMAATDIDKLTFYLQQLSKVTKKRFGPHAFDKDSIHSFYDNGKRYVGYIAMDAETNMVVAYAIIKHGCLKHDMNRFQSYGLELNDATDFSFAPSVADEWQGYGIGQALFNFILSDIKIYGVKRILLWGGVQADNKIALHYYEKNNFKKLGSFEYNGYNYDMAFEINDQQ